MNDKSLESFLLPYVTSLQEVAEDVNKIAEFKMNVDVAKVVGVKLLGLKVARQTHI